MSRLRSILRRRDERGFTISELMVAVALASLLAAASLAFLNSTQTRVRYASTETQSLDGARNTLGRLATEVHAAAQIFSAVSACPAATCLTLTFVPAAGGNVTVRYRYDSAASTLYRATGSINAALSDPFVQAGSAAPVVTSIVNGSTAVFCRQAPCTVPSETAIQVTFVINAEPTKPSQAVTLQSYLSPRNL